MTEKKQPKKKFTWTRANIILVTGIVVIMIPVLAFAWILFSAYKETGTPIEGTRLQSERATEITDTQLTELKTVLATVDQVEAVETELKVATLRIYIDAKDTVTEEEYTTLADAVYTEVNRKLPVKDYFSANDSKREYDLEIHFYNDIAKTEADDFIYYILVKNSGMVEKQVEAVTTARNEELAKELRGETVSEGTVEGEGTDKDTGTGE